MSSEQTFTSDLRSTAQDYKRDAARKHKWAYGAIDGAVISGRPDDKPRPHRASDVNWNHRVRSAKSGNQSLGREAKVTRKLDMLEGAAAISDDSSGSSSDGLEDGTVSPSEAVVFSFDAARSPSHGSQILNVALAQAVERFEERETVKLVKDEYDVLDTAGEVIPQPSPLRKSRKGKGKAPLPAADASDADEDYEFV